MKWRLSLLTTLVLGAGMAWGQEDAPARIADRLKVPLTTLPLLKDTQPPTAPSGFKIERRGDRIGMRWDPAVDNLMVAYYELLRREGDTWTPVTVCTMTAIELPAEQLAAGGYALRAVDVDEQRSAPCAAVQLP